MDRNSQHDDGAQREEESVSDGDEPLFEDTYDEGEWVGGEIIGGEHAKRAHWMIGGEVLEPVGKPKAPVGPWGSDIGDAYKTRWGSPTNYASQEVAVEYLNLDPRAEHLIYIQWEESELAFVDGDDVYSEEKGEFHPEFKRILNELGATYLDISTSKTGSHGAYIGELPEGSVAEPNFQIDDEPWGDNEGVPEVEIYTTKHVCVMTGRHIVGTPDEAKPWDQNALKSILEEYDQMEEEPRTTTDFEPLPDDYEPDATGHDETTDDINDVLAAIDRLTADDLPLRCRENGAESSGWSLWDPSYRQSDSGQSLHLSPDRTTFDDKQTGESFGVLRLFAAEQGIISAPGDNLTGADWWEAIRKARERGADIPEYDPDEADGGPTSMLPLARLDALDHGSRRRYAKKRGISWPSVGEVRERLHDAITTSVAEDSYSVKSAPTGAGKTHTVATEPWKAQPELTDDQPVVHAHRTHEARDQARKMSNEAGVDAFTLKGRKELCPVAAGHHDPDNSHDNPPIFVEGEPISEYMDRKCDGQGLPFSHVHRWAEEEVGGDLPCQEGDTECAAMGQFDGIPRDDDGNPAYDVIHATHQFLYVPGLRMHTHVFLDEKPSFGIDIAPGAVRASVNEYLDYVDAPVDDYSELVAAARTGKDPNAPNTGTIDGLTASEYHDSFRKQMEEALNGEDERVECPVCEGEGHNRVQENTLGDEEPTCHNCAGTGSVVESRGQPPLEWYKQAQNAHAMAPAFARGVWNAEESAGGRKHARVPYRPPRWGNEQHDERGWNRVYVDVVLDEQWEVQHTEALPDFALTKSVIGLDAHPQPADPVWLVNVHEDMTTDYTLDSEERTLYRRYERGLFTVQVGEGVQPVASGEWLDSGQGDKFDVNIKQMADHYPDEFDAAITSSKAEKFVRDSMEDAGIEDPETMHYGEEESRNDFAGKKVGLVAGSIDPGDEMVMNLCARMGYDADPCYKECPTCEGTGDDPERDSEMSWCDTCDGSGKVRERGRTFEGDDAEQADAVLQGVREHHVAQSAGRWARDADDPEDHATVYIITEAAPTGFIDAKAEGATWTTNEDQKRRLEYVRDNPKGATKRQVAEACGCSGQAAWRTLRKAENNGLLERTPGAGPYGADVYSPSEGFSPDGAADLGRNPADTVTDRVTGLDTFTVAIDALPNCAFNTSEDERGDWVHQSTFEWYEVADGPPE